MALSSTRYAPSRQAPLLMVRAVAQVLSVPLRHGATGALQAPISGTITILRPDGTALVSAAVVTVSSSIATYAITPPVAETLEGGWTVQWYLVMTDGDFSWREEAFLCEWVPPNVISAVDLYRVQPELAHRIPEAQGTGGTNEGWQPQIDKAYYELVQQLIDDGRKPWLIRSVTGYRQWLEARAVQLAVGTIPSAMGDQWEAAGRKAHFDMVAARGAFRVQYTTDGPGVRRGGSSCLRLAPAGRPIW